MPTINQVVNFRYGLKANLPATKNLNTLYFCTDTLQLFVGDDEYTKVTEKLSAVPKSGAAGTGTPGEHGKLYYYSSNLYLCEVTGGTTPTYTWTTVANINTKNGTVTSVTLKAGTGLSIDSSGAITSTGTRTISHAVPTGATSGATSPSTAQTPTFGSTFNVPVITTDEFGHVTGKGNTTVKIPSQTNLSKGTDTSGTATSLSFGGTFTAMTDTTVSGHTITDQNTTFTMPDISAASSGSGNVITSITASGGVVTATKGSTAVLTSGNQTIAGVKTFSSFPVTPSSAPTTNYQTANKKYVDDKIAAGFAANDAMVFKGTIGTDGTVTALPTTGYSAGWTYRVITAGTYAGVTCEVGDMIVCVKDYATATANSDWSVIQTNIDGAVTHSSNLTSGQVVVADSTGSIKTTGYTIGKSVPSSAVFTDSKVTQKNTTENNSYRLLLSNTPDSAQETNSVLKSDKFRANPATGEFSPIGYGRNDITGQTLDIDTLTLSSGSPKIVKYINKTVGGTANITNIPISNNPFLLDVEIVRYASSSDYITKQTFISTGDKESEYVRWCISGTWGSWKERVFTDTTYSNATTIKAGLMSASDKAKLDNTNITYGICSTGAGTAEKVVTIPDTANNKWALDVGSIIVVKFTATNTAQNPTLNVNDTGAKGILYSTSVITTSNLTYAGYAGRYITYMYDGTQYVFIGQSVDSNTTYTPATLGGGYGTCTTAAATTAKTATLSSYTLVTGGLVTVKFTNDVPASATLNINSKGAKPIYYKGSAITSGIIKAGDTATFIYNTQYHLISLDRDFADYSGIAVGSADKLTTARTIALTGGITGSGSFDGSANLSIATTLANLASNKVTSLTGYAEATTYTEVSTSDSLNTALGKLQKGVTEAKSAASDAVITWGTF